MFTDYLLALVPVLTAAIAIPINGARNDDGFGRDDVTSRWSRAGLLWAAIASLLLIVRIAIGTGNADAWLWLAVIVAVVTVVRLGCDGVVALDFVWHKFPGRSSWPTTLTFVLLKAGLVLASTYLLLRPLG